MLDNFICCNKFFKRVTDCKVVKTGAHSDHLPIQTKFKLTAIKLNIPKSDTVFIDWEEIWANRESKEKFNVKLHLSLMQHGIYEPTKGQRYTTFNSLIFRAASNTATKLKHENKGWFHHSLATLLPVITR